MQVRTRHTPAFGVARLVLAPTEPVLVESGVLLATSFGVETAPKPRAGRVGDGPSAVCAAPAEGGWVDVAPALPGDLHVLELDGTAGWCVARAGFLAAGGSVTFDPAAPPLRALLGGDDGFLNYAAGQGSVVLACYGLLDVVSLRPGEFVTIASGHVLGFPDSMQCRLRGIRPDGPQSVRTGDGLVFDFAGPGLVLTQTRSPRALANWLRGNRHSARD